MQMKFIRGWRASAWAAGIAGVVLGSTGPGCSGDVGDGDDTSSGGESGGAGNAGGDSGSGSLAPEFPLDCDQVTASPTQAGEAPLRRLTHEEYNNTVADLLGDTSRPASAFAPESAVHGFYNNIATQTVTYALADDYVRAAERLAAGAVARLGTLAPCNATQMGDDGCARDFIANFGRRVYRQPLTDEQKTDLFATYQAGKQTTNHLGGLRVVLTRMLVSPYFLYRPEFGGGPGGAAGTTALTAWETATRLSYALWGTMPDGALFDAAEKDQLGSDAEVASQVKRMVADPRARNARRSFQIGWLMLDRLIGAKKDATLFPGFDALMPALGEEVSRLAEDVLGDSTRPLGDLFTADYSYMNKDLAAFFGIPGADRLTATFARVDLAPGGDPGPSWRAGVLTTPGLLAANSKPTETSPILRGRFVADQILCLRMPDPPGDVPPLPASDTSDLTTRERFEQHAESACASCHRVMDPLGFAFENFDTAGRFRDTEKGKPIDASGELYGTDADGPFSHAMELSARIAGSQQMRSCVAELWLRYGLGRDFGAGDERSLDQLKCAMRDKRATFTDLVLAFTRSDAFRYLPAVGGQP